VAVADHLGQHRAHAAGNRDLAATDPGRRDLVLSCGAALHDLEVALAALALPIRLHALTAAAHDQDDTPGYDASAD
jgi:hypothetical protein